MTPTGVLTGSTLTERVFEVNELGETVECARHRVTFGKIEQGSSGVSNAVSSERKGRQCLVLWHAPQAAFVQRDPIHAEAHRGNIDADRHALGRTQPRDGDVRVERPLLARKADRLERLSDGDGEHLHPSTRIGEADPHDASATCARKRTDTVERDRKIDEAGDRPGERGSDLRNARVLDRSEERQRDVHVRSRDPARSRRLIASAFHHVGNCVLDGAGQIDGDEEAAYRATPNR